MNIPFSEFGLIIAHDAEVPFTGYFEYDPLTREIGAIHIETWSRSRRDWHTVALPAGHWLHPIMAPQLEGAYEDEISEAMADYFSADNQEAMDADRRHDMAAEVEA